MNNKLQPLGQQRQTRHLDFFRGFLREPEIVGSVIPSSRFLEQRIIDAADLDQAKLVVELGPGTGSTTWSFLNRLSQQARLLTIEVSQEFNRLLQQINDPRLINHCGSAIELESVLRQHALPSPDAIISGIPFSTLPATVGRQTLEAIWYNLKPEGRFVAYQFRGHVARLAEPIFGKPQVFQELRNIPPMRIFRWQKPVNGYHHRV